MTITHPAGVRTAVATATGGSGITGDATYIHTLADGTSAACLVDGIGHSPWITNRAAFLAEVAARIGATRGPVLGLLAAADTISDPGPPSLPEEDAVAVIATVHPDRPEVAVAWTGDCAAWGISPTTGEVACLTADQSMGRFLRTVNPGGPPEVAAHHDRWVRVSLARSSIATVMEVEADFPLVVLASDGAYQPLGSAFADVVRRLAHASPQELADGLLDSALACAQQQPGERDDATVLVLAVPEGAPWRPLSPRR
ncbi:hypothetical protein [Kitasatospora cineracea]|uniref:hypothetical protein n=1 Tax=Kitasatospora cineracea TaxID=88074 RepID=UPI00340EA4FD